MWFIWMWELNHKEGWVFKNWCFWNAVLEKTLESPLDSKIKPVNFKGSRPWIFTGSESESEVAQSCLILSDPMDCSLPGSSIHGIFQARVLEWGATGPMLKLKLQYFGNLMWRGDSLEKMLMLGKIDIKRRWGWQSMRCLDSITHSIDMNKQTPGDRGGPWGHKQSDTT